MTSTFAHVYHDLQLWARAHGIAAGEKPLKLNKAGEFNGVSVTMNSAFSAEERTYYLVHALGSIVRWSLSNAAVQAMFDELRNAKTAIAHNPGRLERAIHDYRAFESESSEFAVWLLQELGHADAVGSYTNFMRADLEALTQFHREGRAPEWREFFASWNAKVASGAIQVAPFEPKSIPAFRPRRIECQQILQKQTANEDRSASSGIIVASLVVFAIVLGTLLLIPTSRDTVGRTDALSP